MIETGTILQNRYRIEKQIGQGGMGKVYVASDDRFNSTVAIKETVFEDPNLRRAFEHEARLLNSLKHPALPRVSDHFTEENGQFLVMEYIAGEDLAEMIERRGEPFPLEDVLKWANQLCNALEYLHSQSIIHRDIKPQNLKLTKGGQIILLDFGLAKGNPTDSQNQTAAKSIFGYSLNYASLEQIQGTGTEPQSDLYSLAATLYHLLTGTPPADALTRAMKVLNGQPDPLIPANRINQNIPVGVSYILHKAMDLNSGERPESAISMKLMLENSDKSIEASDLPPFEKNSKTDLLNQETKLFSAATNVSPFAQTDVKTKISPEKINTENSLKTNVFGSDFDSKATIIQNETEKSSFLKRPRAIGVAVFGGLILVGSALSAAFFYSSEPHRRNVEIVPAQTELKNSFVVTPPANVEFSNSNAQAEDVESAIKELEKRQTAKENVPKLNALNPKIVKDPKIQTKNVASQSKGGTKDKDSDQVIVNDERIETKDMIIDEKGIRWKAKPPMPPTPPFEFKGLTPEQIRKLESLKLQKNRVILIEPPVPKPTAQNPKPTPQK
ncbi:MAG TPA: protein kinase [Pyrinomonadaceae bacterium]|jgi:serine/threonine protein kinase